MAPGLNPAFLRSCWSSTTEAPWLPILSVGHLLVGGGVTPQFTPSAVQVATPTTPSGVRPLLLWKAITADCVPWPKIPSMAPGLNPAFLRSCWSSTTEAPWLPILSVGHLEVGGVGGVDEGIQIIWPINSLSGFTPGLASSNACSGILFLTAIW